MRAREGWRDGGGEGGGVQEADGQAEGRNMTIYEQAFMKQDGEHAGGAGRPGSPAGASLTQQTCARPPTRASTHPGEGVHALPVRQEASCDGLLEAGRFRYFTSGLQGPSEGREVPAAAGSRSSVQHLPPARLRNHFSVTSVEMCFLVGKLTVCIDLIAQ